MYSSDIASASSAGQGLPDSSPRAILCTMVAGYSKCTGRCAGGHLASQSATHAPFDDGIMKHHSPPAHERSEHAGRTRCGLLRASAEAQVPGPRIRIRNGSTQEMAGCAPVGASHTFICP
ncbi:hypothetical protein GY45DRAFT_1320255 [Cubamyces sp. BRFM 1775]|nr:hypothetical protein GY45DRAFT_1320255 [Cubamyces sp. BRFM 1775]